MDKKAFKLGIMYLRSACLKNTPEFEQEQVEVWWQSLKDLNDRVFLETCKELIKKESWFPAIADIRELVKHPDDPVLAAAYKRMDKLRINEIKVDKEKLKEGKNVQRAKLAEKSVS